MADFEDYDLDGATCRHCRVRTTGIGGHYCDGMRLPAAPVPASRSVYAVTTHWRRGDVDPPPNAQRVPGGTLLVVAGDGRPARVFRAGEMMSSWYDGQGFNVGEQVDARGARWTLLDAGWLR